MARSLFCLLVMVSFSACSTTAQTTLQRRPAAPPEYVLGAGDAITVRVTDLDEIPVTPVIIDPSGTIDLPLAGRVQAAGLTLTQLRTELSGKLSTYINSPEISINLAQSGSQPVSVVGEVNNAGVHQLAGSKTLLEVISLSGGLKADAGSVVIVTRKPKWGNIEAEHVRVDPSTGDSIATFSVDDLLSSKASQDDIVIKPEDVISIPKADLVYVVGDVKKAGGFDLSSHASVSLLQVVSRAEGLGPDSSGKRARILRPVPGGDGTPREIPVNVDKIFAGEAPDVQLFANDVLYIPHNGVKVTARRVMEAAVAVGTGLLIYR